MEGEDEGGNKDLLSSFNKKTGNCVRHQQCLLTFDKDLGFRLTTHSEVFI